MQQRLIASLIALVLVTSAKAADEDLKAKVSKLEGLVSSMEGIVKKMKDRQTCAISQIMMSQLVQEERIRTDGGSGLKQTRINLVGSEIYLTNTHTGSSLAAMHNHANHIYTLGMGEVTAVINGHEFRTRHNDYQLRRRRDTGTGHYMSTAEIDLPEVPESVLNFTNVDDQIAEMREYFVAFAASNITHRDYRPYFRPVISIMEGYWYNPNGNEIDEPFVSDRHSIDATGWDDLRQKIRFSAYTGRKDAQENYSFLPTKIMHVDDDGNCQTAQWQYRITCHAIPKDIHIPLNQFQVVDDLISRMYYRKTIDEHKNSRSARFRINPELHLYPRWGRNVTNAPFPRNKRYRYTFMDKIMEGIPGLDGYNATLKDEQYGNLAYPIDQTVKDTSKFKNVAYYHRTFKEFESGAMGSTHRKRGYSDPDLYMAMTTEKKVAPMKAILTDRKKPRGQQKVEVQQRWSYAIPLEIIYMTPLQRWNPYNIKDRGHHRTDAGRVVTNNGRNGGLTKDKAYDGFNAANCYHTPAALFKGGREVDEGSAADTVSGAVGVLDQKNNMRTMMASGLRIFFPEIDGAGVVRQRWPISPVHGEGGGAWKELDALKHIVLGWKSNSKYFYENMKDLGSCPASPKRRR
ncbi:uncharacterized protein LOC135498698 [Lineus longissimus]|uniref:uncharacterized protein LOC135498698 n=1 Tax=Lineus longissimus TaxID=88925 RepID=UPI002B4D876F